jgi:hypothetical protein
MPKCPNSAATAHIRIRPRGKVLEGTGVSQTRQTYASNVYVCASNVFVMQSRQNTLLQVRMNCMAIQHENRTKRSRQCSCDPIVYNNGQLLQAAAARAVCAGAALSGNIPPQAAWPRTCSMSVCGPSKCTPEASHSEH